MAASFGPGPVSSSDRRVWQGPNPAIVIGFPAHRGVRRAGRRDPKPMPAHSPAVPGASPCEHDLDVCEPHPIRQHEELLDSRVAHREAPDRRRLAVDHDVAAKPLAPVGRGMFPVFLIRVVHPHRQMKQAVGIERVDRVEPLGHLAVTLAQFRSRAAARAENRIPHRLPPTGIHRNKHTQLPLRLEPDHDHARGRIPDPSCREAP